MRIICQLFFLFLSKYNESVQGFRIPTVNKFFFQRIVISWLT